MSELVSGFGSPPIIQYWNEEEIPGHFDPAIGSIKRHNPVSPYLIFNESAAGEFIEEHFTSREVAAFRSCAVPAMQSDYFRYCALHALGGVYSDFDFACIQPFHDLFDGVEGRIFRRPLGMVMNGFLAFCSPAHPFLRLAIDVVTENVERRELEDIMGVTGPRVLTGMAMLHELGSIEAFLTVSAHDRSTWRPKVIAEVAGDFERVAEAFEGLRIEPITVLTGYLSNLDIAHAPHKQHWTKWQSSIYR